MHAPPLVSMPVGLVYEFLGSGDFDSVESLARNLPGINPTPPLYLSPDQEVRIRTGLLALHDDHHTALVYLDREIEKRAGALPKYRTGLRERGKSSETARSHWSAVLC